MNRIFDRYLARQILVATLSAVVILTLVFGLGNIFKRALPQLVDDTLSIERFLQFILYILPFAVAYTIPWGFLSAVLLTFGRLSADNELVSMRMSGRSMWRLCLPVFVIAALLSGVCFWLNLSVSPRAKGEMKRIVKDVLSDDPSLIFREKGILDNMIIHVDPVDKWNGENIRFVSADEWNRPVLWGFAERLELKKEGETLTAELLDVKIEWRESAPVETNDDALLTYPFDPKQSQHPEVANFPLEIALRSSKLKPNEMTVQQLKSELTFDELPKDDAAEYRTELTKRYSISLACIAFCFVGIPLGVTAQRRETSIGFALSLAVAVTYFLFIFLGETFGEDDSLLPHILMWAPSVLFIGIGGILFYRVSKR
jgi:lipopolysaccharide export LptBFGC system permease protein LptF